MKKKIQKPFDAEAAKRGAKIETRNGKSVRIVCYDKKGVYSIIALIDYGEVENYSAYTIKGGLIPNETSEEDLVIIEEVEYPKFKVGDWVIKDNGGRAWLITVVTSDCYLLQDLQGHGARAHHGAVDTCSRLWTLKDAKPGNILVSTDGNRPFIFRGLYYDSTPTAYCGIDATDSIYISGGNNLWTAFPVRPATYEERLQLFNKLEEEGYKWDADSLTVSKIQKRWRDDENTEINGYYINDVSRIAFHSGKNACMNYNIFSTKKQIKSALAMARISQIMANDERFGGVVTDDEWDSTVPYFVIVKVRNMLVITRSHRYEYLGFHTMEQANLFLEENEDLVKDYYMMD